MQRCDVNFGLGCGADGWQGRVCHQRWSEYVYAGAKLVFQCEQSVVFGVDFELMLLKGPGWTISLQSRAGDAVTQLPNVV